MSASTNSGTDGNQPQSETRCIADFSWIGPYRRTHNPTSTTKASKAQRQVSGKKKGTVYSISALTPTVTETAADELQRDTDKFLKYSEDQPALIQGNKQEELKDYSQDEATFLRMAATKAH